MASLVDSQALLSFINLDGGFAAQIASTVVAGTAKSIELALATIFVTFLGQVLSRDALDVRSSITLADMQLKMVLLQPGSVISKFSSYRRTTKALLGLPTMLAALVAMIYTTASDTLGMSLESFLNYQAYEQPNQVWNETESMDMSFHAYDKSLRVQLDSIATYGTWLERNNTDDIKDDNGRKFERQTLVMPHAGLANAWDETLYQTLPNELHIISSLVDAQVISPAVNADTNWPLDIPSDWFNKTVFDKLFQLSPHKRLPPASAFLPSPGKIVMNTTEGADYYGSHDTVDIVLNKSIDYSGSMLDAIHVERPYMLCSMFMSLEQDCSSYMELSTTGQSLWARCGPQTTISYRSKKPRGVRSILWPDIATIFATAAFSTTWEAPPNDWINMTFFEENKGGVIGYLLSDLVPRDKDNMSTTFQRPTMAEALAILSSYTLLLSSKEADYDDELIPSDADPRRLVWPLTYTHPFEGSFDALVRTPQCTNGAHAPWQNIFNAVLAAAFIMSATCLIYFANIARKDELVTDFLELPNIITLAVQSPCDDRLEGSEGRGLNRTQLREKWSRNTCNKEKIFIGNPTTMHEETSTSLQEMEIEDTGSLPPRTYKPTLLERSDMTEYKRFPP
ncbi:MAG: hypothetical protein MMC23_006254 [Stictis urceolatum]|nr:hypothetical protein [Stictis urceolata]